jgi:hypothetical protein
VRHRSRSMGICLAQCAGTGSGAAEMRRRARTAETGSRYAVRGAYDCAVGDIWVETAGQTEIPLAGGDVTEGVVRAGDTVRRPVGPHSPLVHALQAHLESAGFEGAPRFLGIDGAGREVLSYIEGEVAGRPRPPWIADETRLASVGRLVRLTGEPQLVLAGERSGAPTLHNVDYRRIGERGTEGAGIPVPSHGSWRISLSAVPSATSHQPKPGPVPGVR